LKVLGIATHTILGNIKGFHLILKRNTK